MSNQHPPGYHTALALRIGMRGLQPLMHLTVGRGCWLLLIASAALAPRAEAHPQLPKVVAASDTPQNPTPTDPQDPLADVVQQVQSWQNQSVRMSDAPPRLQTILRQLLIDNIPHEFEDVDEWGKTEKVWDGLHVQLHGLKVHTKRKWKKVNQGTWKRHRISLVDPDKHLRVEFRNLQPTEHGTWSFDLLLAARLNAYGRLSEWQRGIRLYSISGDANVDVRLKMQCELKARLDPTRFPPDLVIEPKVTSAKLKVTRFRLRRISHADGPLVKQLGKSIRGIVERELAKKNKDLVAKINKKIARHEDDLTFSLHAALLGHL